MRTFNILMPAFAAALAVLLWQPAMAASGPKPATPAAAEKCIKEVMQAWKKVPNTPGVVLKTARRMCWITADREQAIHILNQPGGDGIAISSVLRDQVAQASGGTFSKSYAEWGIRRIGGEPFLNEMFAHEMIGIWLAAKINGGPAELPTPEEVETYARVLVNAVLKDSNRFPLVLARLYSILKEAALKQPRGRTQAEKKFVSDMEAYVQSQHQRMAKHARFAFDEYQKTVLGGDNILAKKSPPPFDPLDEMRAAIAVSPQAASVGMLSYRIESAIGGASDLAGLAGFSQMDAIESIIASGAFKKLIKVGIKTVNKAAAKALVSSSRLALGRMLAAFAAKAALKALKKAASKVSGILTAVDLVVQVYEDVSNTADYGEMKAKLDTAILRAENFKPSLKNMLNTRGGGIQVQYFYAKATASSSPSGFKPKPNRCQVCFYDQAFNAKRGGYNGSSFCASASVSDLRSVALGSPNRLGGVKNWNNKIRAFQFITDDCPKASVTLHENQRHTGDKKRFTENVPDLSTVVRKMVKTVGGSHRAEHWDNQATSIGFSSRQGPRCEVCYFAGARFSGARYCSSASLTNLHDLGMGDRITSIQMRTRDCKDAKLWLYERKELKRHSSGSGVRVLSNSTNNIGQQWNDKISSVYFSQDGRNPMEERDTGGCRACLYEHTAYRGEYLCLSAGDRVTDLSRFSSGEGVIKFSKRASSVQFLTKSCEPGGQLTLQLYSKPGTSGEKLVLKRSTSNLGKFNDKASSAILTLMTEEEAEVAQMSIKQMASSLQARLSAQAPAQTSGTGCEVCLYSDANYRGQKKCLTGKHKTLRKMSFNNKVSSVKFNLAKCKKGAAIFYENELKGDKGFAFKDIPNLSKIRRGKRGNWNDKMSSIHFEKDMKTILERAYKPSRKPVPWMN